MKIAITDYDGTLKSFEYGVTKNTIEAIHQWRQFGNKFGIATGRNLKLLDFELRNYDITLDFLICVNGAVIINKDKEILYSAKIPPSIMKKFIKLPLVKDTDNPMIVFCEREAFSIRPYPEMSMELTPQISFEEVVKREDVVQFGIKFKTSEEALNTKYELEKDFPTLGGNPNRQFLDINIRGVDKASGIAKLVELMNWQDCPLFVIGDDSNDLPMIKRFKGFTVETAAPFMQKAASKVYESVGEMLLDNLT